MSKIPAISGLSGVPRVLTQAGVTGAAVGTLEKLDDDESRLQNMALKSGTFMTFAAGGLLLNKGIQAYKSKFGKVPAVEELRDYMVNQFSVKRPDVPPEEVERQVEGWLARKIREQGGWENVTKKTIKQTLKQAKRASKTFKKKTPADPIFTPSDPEVAARMKAAEGVPKDPLSTQLKVKMVKAKNKWQRTFEHLPNTKENSKLQFDLLKLKKAKDITFGRTVDAQRKIIGGLSNQEYGLFRDKVVNDDLMASIDRGESVAFGYQEKQESLAEDAIELEKQLELNPKVQEAISRRKELSEDLKQRYTTAMGEAGFDVSKRLTRKDYFPHVILEHAKNKQAGVSGTGQTLKTPTSASHLKRRKGSELDYNIAYDEAETEVMWQMEEDIEKAQTIKSVDDNYNIVDQVKTLHKKKLQALADELDVPYNPTTPDHKIKDAIDAKMPGLVKERHLDDWHNSIPKGHKTFQPIEGNTFYLAQTVPERLAEKLLTGVLENAEISKDTMKEVLAVGGKRREMVLRDEVVDTLKNLNVSHDDPGLHKKAINSWKSWVLTNPWRLPKFITRNASGDADFAFIGNPSTFKELPSAISDLYKFYYKGGEEIPEELKDWVAMGGAQSTLQAQELSDLKEFKSVLGKGNKNRFKAMWEGGRKFADYRESWLRYAAYKDYLRQMKSDPNGIPDNFGFSNPDEVMGLSDIKERAFLLQNELLGAYDRVSVAGQKMRERWYPFWSYRETAMKRFIQGFINAKNEPAVMEKLGKKWTKKSKYGKHSRFMAIRIGRFITSALSLWAITQVYNHTRFPEEEASLPESIKSRPHIVIGRDKETGKVEYFSRIGAAGDFLELFGLDNSPKHVKDWLNNKKTLGEIATDMAGSPLNSIAQGAIPFAKLGVETATGRSLFPDIRSQRTIRDKGLHIARFLSLDKEYIALMGLPSKGYLKNIPLAFKYEIDPLQAAYSKVYQLKRDFLKEKGKIGEGFWLTDKGNALYNLKLAIKYKDKEATDKFLLEYAHLAGIMSKDGAIADLDAEQQSFLSKKVMASLLKMHPLSGLTKPDTAEFLGTLNDEDKTNYSEAQKFWVSILVGGVEGLKGSRERQLSIEE